MICCSLLIQGYCSFLVCLVSGHVLLENMTHFLMWVRFDAVDLQRSSVSLITAFEFAFTWLIFRGERNLGKLLGDSKIVKIEAFVADMTFSLPLDWATV